MMLLLRDDLVIETFESLEHPPSWIEWIDVENGEYEFCSGLGQRYQGELTRPSGFFRSEEWHLVPVGQPDIVNAMDLAERARGVEPRRSEFPDLESLRRYLAGQES